MSTMSPIQMKMKRIESILTSLDKLGYASRSQLQKLHDLKSNRNACRVLKNMSEYLNVMRLDENVYYLNKKGRELIGSTNERKKTMQIEHHLMRNDVYIYFNCPKKWFPERAFVPDFPLVSDAVFLEGSMWKFLEVDNMQKMANNVSKLDRYKELKDKGVIQKKNTYFPTLIWVTTTEHRREKLKKMCAKRELAAEVYVRADLL